MDNLVVQNNHTGPKYIPLENLLYYSSKGFTNEEIAKQVGCNTSNVTTRLNTVGYKKDRINQYKAVKGDLFNFVQSLFLNSLTVEEIQKAPTQVKLTGIGILEDKIQALERREIGQVDPTDRDDLMHSLANIASRSPQVINNIINVVGGMSDDIRDRLSRILPQSLTSTNNPGNIIDGKLSHE